MSRKIQEDNSLLGVRPMAKVKAKPINHYNICKSVISSRNKIPILQGVVIEKDTISASDLEATVRVCNPYKISGSMVLPLEAIKGLPAGAEITIDDECGNVAHINNSEWVAYPINDYPKLPVAEGDVYTLPNTVMTAAKQSIVCANNENTRLILNGVYFDFRNTLNIVSSDGRWMFVHESDVDFPLGDYIVPVKAVKLIARYNLYRCRFGERQATFFNNDVELTTQLIEGDFPNWQHVIPKSLPNKFKVDYKVFKKALDNVSVMASKGINRCVFSLKKNGRLMMECNDPDRGKAQEFVEFVEPYTGEKMQIAFQCVYLKQAIDSYKAPMMFAMSAPLNPAVITSRQYPNTKILLMPMKII